MADNSKGKQSRFDLIIGAVDKFSNVFKGFNDRVESATADLNRMQKAVTTLNRVTGLSRLSGAVSGVAGSMKNVVNEGKALVGTVVGLAGKFSLIFGAAGGGLFALAKSTANAGDAAAKAAARAGVGVKTWQEYAYAASLSDVSNEQLEKSFVKLQDIAIKAFKGDKTQQSLLKLAGIDPKTANGEIKNADSIMLELADKVKALQDAGQGAKAVNLVKSILGDEGAKLMPMLLGGAAGLKDMRLEAHKLGLVLSADDAKASEEFNDGLTKMLGSLKGIGYSIGRVLLPPLTKLMGKFTDWFAKQRDIISGGFAEWIEKLDIDRIWNSIESGINTLGSLAATVNGLAQAFGGWENVLIALAAVISGKFLLSIGSLIASFAKLGFAFATNPLVLSGVGMLMKLVKSSFMVHQGIFGIGKALLSIPVAGPLALLAGLGTVAYAIYKNWDGFVGYFENLFQGVRDAFSRSWTEGILKALWDFNPLRLVLKGINELVAYFTGFNPFEEIGKRWGQQLTGWIPDSVKEFFDIGSGDDEGGMSTADDSGGGWQGSGMGAPLNLASARGVAETRTEHVEKNELLIKVRAENGANAYVSGFGGTGVSTQTGQLMFRGG